jgi:Fur family ferric uptake transcriptional regulator
MCSHCDPRELLEAGGLKATPQRERVLRAVLTAPEALAAPALLAKLREEEPMDKVTLYRALDALTEHGIITRHEAGDGSLRYCAAGPGHPDHHHFYCLRCRRLLCLDPDAVTVGADMAGVEHVSVRLDGTCAQCRG